MPPGPVQMSCVAVFTTAALTCSASQLGWAARTRAAMPATCGLDIDVPDREFGWLPAPEAADRICVPGAATSGLPWPSEPCTPRDEPRVEHVAGDVLDDRAGQPGADVDRQRAGLDLREQPSVVAAVIWKPGMAALPEMPAGNGVSSVGSSTPTAPAAVALLNRTTEPQRAGGVVVVPPEVGDLAGDGGGLGRGERGAAVEVAAGVADGCGDVRAAVGDRVLAGVDARRAPGRRPR